MRRVATALSLGALASMWSVCSTVGMQSWNRKADDLKHLNIQDISSALIIPEDADLTCWMDEGQ